MLKADLRKKYKELRKEISFEEIQYLSLEIANQLLQLPIWDKTYFHLFLPIEKFNEVNTEYALQILAGRDKEIILSKSDFDRLKMTHYLLTDNTTIKVNTFGIPEPIDGLEVPVTKIEVVFVPLLAFDKKGNRIGYGKGFYDIFLAECNTNIIKIGLSCFEAEELIADVSETDIKLDFCVTPHAIYKF